VLVAALGSSPSNSSVKTTGAAAPVVPAPPQQSAPTKHATDTTFAVSTPATSVTHTTTAPTHNNKSTPAPPPAPAHNNTPPPTSAPQPPLDASVLQWTVTPGSTVQVSKDGTVTLSVSVHNPTNRAVEPTPYPVGCPFGEPNVVCTAGDRLWSPNETRTATVVLQGANFTKSTTVIDLGGVYKITVELTS
jgi:hypothetical protein